MGQGTWGMADETDEEVRRLDREAMREKMRSKQAIMPAAAMRALYDTAQKAAVGSIISCPNCGKQHTKNTYSKVFCSNHKTAGTRNCKDAYWNTVDPSRFRYVYSR